MKWICQLGDGYMLAEDGTSLKKINTGYPYPDTDAPQIDELYNMVYFIFSAGNYSLRRYIKSDVVFKKYYKDIIDIINTRFNSLGVDTMDILDLFGTSDVNEKLKLYYNNGFVKIVRTPNSSKYYNNIANFNNTSIDDSKYLYVIVPSNLESSLGYSINSLEVQCNSGMTKPLDCLANIFKYADNCYYMTSKVFDVYCNKLHTSLSTERFYTIMSRLCDLRYKFELEKLFSHWNDSVIDIKSFANKLPRSSRAFISKDFLFNNSNVSIIKNFIFEDYNVLLKKILSFETKKNTAYSSKTGVLKVKVHTLFNEIENIENFRFLDDISRSKQFNELKIFKYCYTGFKDGYMYFDLTAYVSDLNKLSILRKSNGFKTSYLGDKKITKDDVFKAFGLSKAGFAKFKFFNTDDSIVRSLEFGFYSYIKNLPIEFSFLRWLCSFSSEALVTENEKGLTLSFNFFSIMKDLVTEDFKLFVKNNTELFSLLAFYIIHEINMRSKYDSFYTMTSSWEVHFNEDSYVIEVSNFK